MVRIGFKTFVHQASWPNLRDTWTQAGELEVFESAWINDHLVDFSHEHDGPAFEAITLLAALAPLVPGKRVGHLTLCNTFRPPQVVARSALTMDHITGGRFVLALGAGWHAGEHEANGIEFPAIGERLTRLEAALRVIRAMFREEGRQAPGVTLTSGPYALSGAILEPAPLRPGGPEIMVGGQGERTVRIAGRHADWWNYSSNSGGGVERFLERRDALRRASEAAGRDADAVSTSIQVMVDPNVSSRAGALADARAYVRVGAQEVIFGLLGEVSPAVVRAVATDVAEPLRDVAG